MSSDEGGDFLARWLRYVEHVSAPDIFKLWGGISLVARALERRILVKTRFGISFPNLYVLLVAPPGVGKKVILSAKNLIEGVRKPGTTTMALHVAPESMTRSSMIDGIVKAKQIFTPPKGDSVVYHSLSIFIEEFGVL